MIQSLANISVQHSLAEPYESEMETVPCSSTTSNLTNKNLDQLLVEDFEEKDNTEYFYGWKLILCWSLAYLPGVLLFSTIAKFLY